MKPTARDLERRTFQGLLWPMCFVCDKLVDEVNERHEPSRRAIVIGVKCHGSRQEFEITFDQMARADRRVTRDSHPRLIAFEPPKT